MGIFSSKKIRSYYAVSMGLIEDTPNIVKDTVVNSILRNRNLSDDLKVNLKYGYFNRINLMWKYADKHYTRGLPSGTVSAISSKDNVLTSIIETYIAKHKIVLDLGILDSTRPDYFGLEFCTKYRGLKDLTTNIITKPPINIPSGNSLVIKSIISLSNNRLKISYALNNPINAVHYSEDVTTVSTMLLGNYYYHCVYYLVDAAGNVIVDSLPQYWFYNPADKIYQDLNVDFVNLIKSPYYPVFPIRENYVNMGSNKNSELYKTTKDSLNKIYIEFDDVVDGIHDNPDIGLITDSYIYLGINILSTKKSNIKYIFEYFNFIKDSSPVGRPDYDNWFHSSDRSSHTPNYNSATVISGAFVKYIEYMFIDKTIIRGVLGPVGTYTRSNILDSVIDGIYRGNRYRERFQVDTSYILIRKQVTPLLYEELRITGPYSKTKVHRGVIMESSLRDALSKPDEEVFTLPLNINILSKLSIKDRYIISYDALKVQVMAYDETKLKWYQRGFFKIFTIVIAIAITIVFDWSGTSLAATIATMSAATLATNVLIILAIQISLTIGAKYLVKEFGGKDSFFAALLIAMFAAFEAFTGNFTSSTLLLFQTSNAITSAINKDIDKEISDLLDEEKDFVDEQTKLKNELDDLEDELKSPANINIYDLIANETNMFNPAETPKDFLKRNIGLKNIGVELLKVIPNYVDSILDLPNTTDTLKV